MLGGDGGSATTTARSAASVRLQPNQLTDDARGIAASIRIACCWAQGDNVVIAINPATDKPERAHALLSEHELGKLDPDAVPVLVHVTTTPS